MKQKKIKLERRLTLDKESIVKLQESQLAHIKGGNFAEAAPSCAAFTCNQSCDKGTCNGVAEPVNEL
ncbi:MAG: class I lanthipeptide [Bacteroidetes bacterium]|nr:class I lanthipeptide [Bacteroidota bacterium]